MFGNDCLVLRQLLENLQKSLESLWKSLGNHQKSCHYYVYINNNQNNTWLLVDIEFLFPCLTWYLTHLLHSLARYQVEHSTRNSISTHPCIILCLHTKFQPAGFSTGEILEMASIKVLSMTLVGGCPCSTHQNIMQEAHSNFLWRAHSWQLLKAGFHYWRSRSRSHSWSQSCKRPYDLVKIENRSPKQSHKLDGIRVGRIRTFPFLPIPFMTLSLMIQWKLGCRSWKQKWKNQPITRPGVEHCHWFILPLLFCLRLRQCNFHLIASDGVISRISVLLPTPSVWFSLDRIALRFWLRFRIRLCR